MNPGDHIAVGQIYASTHSGDIKRGQRQRRRVVEIDLDGPFVWLQTLCRTANPHGISSRIHLRSPRSRTIPGHRLVEDVA